jgi:hypothetical protein
MTEEHKAALARGREEGRVVRRYLEALAEQQPARPGRRRSPEAIQRRLAAIEAELPEADVLTRLHLLQERSDLRAELRQEEPEDTLATLERAFVKVAAAYSERKGIEYATWRAAGVSAQVLDRAGVKRSGRTPPG